MSITSETEKTPAIAFKMTRRRGARQTNHIMTAFFDQFLNWWSAFISLRAKRLQNPLHMPLSLVLRIIIKDHMILKE